MEDTKNTDKKEKESPELKEELSDEELKGLSGGVGVENTGIDASGGTLKGQKNDLIREWK